MTQAGQTNCTGCGRPQWAGDNFCAKCGQAFGVEYVGRAPGPGAEPVQFNDVGSQPAVFDLDAAGEVTSAPVKPEANRYLRYAVAGIAVLIAAVIGIPALLGAGDNESATAPSATPLPTFTPVPTARATATPDPTATPSRPSDTEAATTVEAAPTAAQEADEAGAAVLAELSGFFYFTGLSERLVNLATGEQFEIPSGVVAFENVRALSSHGVIVSGPDGYAFHPWDNSEPVEFPLDESETPVLLLDDPDAGLVAVVAPLSPTLVRGPTAVVQISTGERRSLDVPEAVAADNPHVWDYGFPWANRVRSALVMSADTGVFRWGWSDGWQEIAEGRVRGESADGFIVVDNCDTPTECNRQLMTVNGEIVDEFATASFIPPWSSGLAPGGRYASMDDFSQSAPRTSVVDLATGDVVARVAFDTSRGSSALRWLGPHVFLTTSSNPTERNKIMDARAGRTAKLEALEGAQTGIWIPDAIGAVPLRGE